MFPLSRYTSDRDYLATVIALNALYLKVTETPLLFRPDYWVYVTKCTIAVARAMRNVFGLLQTT